MKSLVYLALTLSALAAPLNALIPPEEALKRLIDGNARYTKDQFVSPDRTQERRDEVASTQTPFAVIVGCSDSRVTPEIIFDQGIGDLFVVRVAGNVVAPVELDSIDYSVGVLGSTLVLVLGHESCGAVKAVLNDQTKTIEALANLIEPAISKVKDAPGDPLTNAVKANAKSVADYLKTTTLLRKKIQEGTVKVLAGYYNLRSGKVDILPE